LHILSSVYFEKERQEMSETSMNRMMGVLLVVFAMLLTGTAAIAYTVTFAANPAGGGALTGSTLQVVASGASATPLTATANTGYVFVNWTGTGGFITTNTNPLTVGNVTSDMTITANFQAQHNIIFQADAGGSIISGITNQTVADDGNSTPVQAAANFTYWSGPNGFMSTANPLTVTNVKVSGTYTAYFTSKPPFIDVNSDNKMGLEEVIYILRILAGI
jgi:uncharacterized repeat protein (TIGR02543 family)